MFPESSSYGSSKLAPKNESSVCSFGIISIDSNSPGSIAGTVISDFIPSCVNVKSVISSSVSLLIKTTKFGWKSRNTVSPPPTTVIIIKTKIYFLKSDVLQIIYSNMIYHVRINYLEDITFEKIYFSFNDYDGCWWRTDGVPTFPTELSCLY